ncbi:MAG: hypothetical protein JWN70_636 [Planctomycetaceae bacterium]|nr:hypothetical protein [Planctomycetaceae bacterium]
MGVRGTINQRLVVQISAKTPVFEDQIERRSNAPHPRPLSPGYQGEGSEVNARSL